MLLEFQRLELWVKKVSFLGKLLVSISSLMTQIWH